MLSTIIIIAIVIVIALIIIAAQRANAQTGDLHATPSRITLLYELDKLLDKWFAERLLNRESVDYLRTLIQHEQVQPPSSPEPVSMPVPMPPPASAMQEAPIPVLSTNPTPVEPKRATQTPTQTQPQPSLLSRLRNATLALRTTQTLLFLGAFLLVTSALVLVAFNWASFSPVLQFGLLASVCGGLWGAGAWLAHSKGSARAGLGLQIAGGVLLPIVAFSLSRPGLLNLAPRSAWLVTSALSLPVYAMAAWRMRQPVFLIAACLSVANTVMASLGFLDNQWLPASLILTLGGFLLMAHALRHSAPELAPGPRGLAHLVAPTTLVVSTLLRTLRPTLMSDLTLALTLWAGVAFYMLALVLERKFVWACVAAALPLLALPITLSALSASPWAASVVPAACVPAYIAIAILFDRAGKERTWVGYVGACVMAVISLTGSLLQLEFLLLRASLPWIMLGSFMVIIAYHAHRFQWVSEDDRIYVPTIAASIMGALLPFWLVTYIPFKLSSGLYLSLAITTAYVLSAAFAQRTRFRYWAKPGITLGILSAITTLGIALLESALKTVWLQHIGAVVMLAFIAIIAGIAWRKAGMGYIAASLITLAVYLAARRWQLTSQDFSFALCALSFGFVCGAQLIRRKAKMHASAYALPYEVCGLLLPLLSAALVWGNAMPSTLVWLWLMLAWGWAAHHSQRGLLLVPALLAMDMLLLSGASWLFTGGRPAGAGFILLAAAWVQTIIGLKLNRKLIPSTAKPFTLEWNPGFIAAAFSATGAVMLASSAADVLATVLLGLAAMSALVATLRREECLAWSALALLMSSAMSAHAYFGLSLQLSAAVLVGEWLAVSLITWPIKNSVWQRPLRIVPLAAASALTVLLAFAAMPHMQLTELSYALAGLSLLLVASAIRHKHVPTAYGAAATLVLAGWCRLFMANFVDAQWYIAPVGLYLLALAAGLRLIYNNAKAAQWVESCATVLLLGVTSLQMLGVARGTSNEQSQLYAVALCAESLVLLGYGTLRQLRVPFVGGALFFITGVLWLSVDPLRSANKWVLFGGLGLLMIAAYVVLEHHKTRLQHARAAFVERVSGWG